LRQIGTLPRNLDPHVFGDHLLSLGMKTRFDEQPEGWLVWIYNEDHLEQAKAELQDYLIHPEDPRYGVAVRAAQTIRSREQKLDREFRKNYREVTDQWAQPTIRRRPLTMLLVLVSVGVYVLQNFPVYGDRILDWLGFFSFSAGPPELRPWRGLSDIVAGQLWRLVTPIFLHFKLMGVPILHLLFNMGWLIVLGTMIELRRGTSTLAVLVLATAILSNLAEYEFLSRYLEKYYLFGGMSGVVYGLFGYVWMKSIYEPEQGMILHPNNVSIMLIWLVLCMTGALGSVANAAHAGGLIVGMALGVSRL
jgi:GlpG protein